MCGIIIPLLYGRLRRKEIEVHETWLLGVDMVMKGRKRQNSSVGTGEIAERAQQLPTPLLFLRT